MEGMGEDINLIPILEYIFWLHFTFYSETYMSNFIVTLTPPPPRKKSQIWAVKSTCKMLKHDWLTEKDFFLGGGGGERFSSYLIKFL